MALQIKKSDGNLFDRSYFNRPSSFDNILLKAFVEADSHQSIKNLVK